MVPQTIAQDSLVFADEFSNRKADYVINQKRICCANHTCLSQLGEFVVGYPSVCCEYVLLPLVNKEADLTNSQAE